ncbi:MAG: hypothetical protein AAF690_19240 [Acidobacteriota bacterium]
MQLILLTVVAVGLVMLAMSVGVMFTGRCLRGSCGGPDILGPDGQSVLCGTCPNRTDEPSEEAA